MTHTTRISGPARYLVVGAALAGIFVSTAVAGGRLIAFSRGDLDELEGSVYLMRADGTRVRRVPTASPAVDPSWQPLPERR